MLRTKLHIYPSPIISEARIFKETKALKAFGLIDHVRIIGISKQGIPLEQALSDSIIITRIRTYYKNTDQNKLKRYLSFVEFVFCGRGGAGQ